MAASRNSVAPAWQVSERLIACLYPFRCTVSAMKRRDLLQRLAEVGWVFIRQGGEHEIWGNRSGTATEAIPRHREISERLADKIIRTAKRNP